MSVGTADVMITCTVAIRSALPSQLNLQNDCEKPMGEIALYITCMILLAGYALVPSLGGALIVLGAAGLIAGTSEEV